LPNFGITDIITAHKEAEKASFCWKLFFMKVHSIETFGTHEGPGIRLVVFLQGCNFKCAYCHNPDTISFKGGYNLSVKEILKILEEQRPYFNNIGGLTVSGGEPTIQSEEVLELFKEAGKLGFNTALDTNGGIINDDIKELLQISDLVLFDLKHFNDMRHLNLTGCSNVNILENIKYRERLKKPFWIRHVLVPGYTDDENHLKSIAKYLSEFKYLKYLEILPYHNLGIHKYKELGLKYRLNDIKPASVEDLKKAVNILKKYLPEKIIRY
jgi:pyruvate formate lyase activating enzyme